MKCIAVAVLFVIQSHRCLFAQEVNCSTVPNAASAKLLEVVSIVKTGNFRELKSLLEASWSLDPQYADNIFPALRELEAIKSFSKGLSLVEMCTEGSTKANGYYENGLTQAVDRFRIALDASTPPRITHIVVYRAERLKKETRAGLTESERLANLDAYVHGLAKAGAFSGVVMLAKSGKPIYTKAFGKRFDGIPDTISLEDPFDPVAFTASFRAANRAPRVDIRTTDRFNLASLNKIVTAVAILQLVERKKIGLDDRLRSLLPKEPMSDEVGEVQLKHLLSHTSGLKYDLQSLSFTPGSAYAYNNFNFGLLGDIISAATGLRYDDYIRLHILGPMGMANTASIEFRRFNSQVVIGNYEDIRGEEFVVSPNPYLQKYPGSAMGGMYSTADDLLRFAEGLRTHKLLQPASLGMMRAAKTELHAPNYGFGVMRGDGGIWGHSGRLPGADADLEIYGDSGFVAIVLANQSEANPPVLAKIRSLFWSEAIEPK